MKHTLPQPADTPMVEKPLILGRSVVAMVQPTQAPPRNHLTTTHRPGPISRCSFTQPEVRAVVVVVREVIGEESFQVSLVQRNGLVEQFASAAPYPALRDSVLPGTLNRGLYAGDLHGSNRSRNVQPILCVVVKDEKFGRGLIRKGFAQLLYDPGARRMASDVEVQDAATVVADNEEAIENMERESRDRKEIHGRDGLAVIT